MSAYTFVRDLVGDGGTILFVGTKKQTQDPVSEFAASCGMPYVNERWLGGMLTNFETIAGRVRKLAELETARDTGEFDALPKKEALVLSRELEKLERNLGGIRRLSKLPNAIFVIDTKKEHIAVTEANKLGLPVVAVVDTNCDPDVIDYVIPGNDDAIRSARLMCRVIADAVNEGRFIAARRPVGTPSGASGEERRGGGAGGLRRSGGAAAGQERAGAATLPAEAAEAAPAAPVEEEAGAPGVPAPPVGAEAAEATPATPGAASEAADATPAASEAAEAAPTAPASPLGDDDEVAGEVAAGAARGA